MNAFIISLTLLLRGLAFPEIGATANGSGAASRAEAFKSIGQTHFDAGRYQEAETSYRRALAANPEGELLAAILNNLGATLPYVGKDQEAVEILHRGLKVAESVLGEDHPRLRPLLNNLAVLHRKRVEHQKALTFLKRAVRLGGGTAGKPQPDMVFTLHNLAWVYFDMGQIAKAEKVLSDCESLLHKLPTTRPALAGPALSLRARIRAHQGDYSAASAIYEQIIGMLVEEHGTGHPAVAAVLSDLAEVQAISGLIADAEESLERALQILREAQADTHPAMILALVRLAELRLARKQYDSAVSLFQQANSRIEGLHGPNYVALAATAPGYANALRKAGREGEAREVERRAASIRALLPAGLGEQYTVDLKSLVARKR